MRGTLEGQTAPIAQKPSCEKVSNSVDADATGECVAEAKTHAGSARKERMDDSIEGSDSNSNIEASSSAPVNLLTPETTRPVPFSAPSRMLTLPTQSISLIVKEGHIAGSPVLEGRFATRALGVNPSSIAFGNVAVNSAMKSVFTLKSTGKSAITISASTLTGTGFTMTGLTMPLTLNSGQSVTVNVQFAPVQAGSMNGVLTFATNGTNSTTTKVSLSGTGVANAPTLSALSCGSASITGAGTDACTVTLSGAAPSGGLSVAVTSSNAAVTVPSTLLVPANATSAGFTATVSAVGTAQTVTLTASSTGVAKSFALQLNASVPTLSVSASSLVFGSVPVNTATTKSLTLTSTGTAPVTISGATVNGTGFAISGSSLPVTLNSNQSTTVTVQFDPTTAGAATGQVTITSNSSTNPSAVVSLSGSGTSTTPLLSAMSCTSASMTGAGTDACSVTLSSAAPSGGVAVSLSSNNSAVTVPGTVTVPVGATVAGFTATVASVSTTQAVTISGTANSVTKGFALQLNVAVSTLSISGTTINYGSVDVGQTATQVLTLTSTGTAPVTVSGLSIAGSLFTEQGVTAPLTLNPGQKATLNAQFYSDHVSSFTGVMTITSNSSLGNIVVNMAGSGVAVKHIVSLTWQAPASGNDPVMGYHVYRSPSGASSYQLVNSACTLTNYDDNTVQSATSYDYIVKSVDNSGVESSPSNVTTVAVP